MPEPAAGHPATIPLSVGALTPEQIDLMLTHLPVDVTYVDESDTVAYYSATPGRIFIRVPAVVGRKVQDCHPSKSIGIVKRILAAFKAGTRTSRSSGSSSRAASSISGTSPSATTRGSTGARWR